MRLKALDILRALAILLVLGRHFNISEPWYRGGWSGVDLFFVLSGFLISGLLFSEYKKTGDIRIGRFLIRRGFKIYPPYYLFLGWTAVMFIIWHDRVPARSFVPELFFLQSYWPGRWPHTWSLAVEEHFYLVLPVLLILLCRLSGHRQDPFRALVWLFAGLAAGSLVLRVLAAWTGFGGVVNAEYTTHMNLDGLLFGVLLSYFYHFRRTQFDRLSNLPGPVLLTGSILLVAPCFFLTRETSPFVATIGHPMLYMGYGGLLLFALGKRAVPRLSSPLTMVGDLFATIGKHSYSIYLWHYPMSVWGLELLRRKGLLPAGRGLQFLLYALGSVTLGMGMALLVEIPSLKLRDRIFPSRSSALLTPPEKDSAQVVGTLSSVADATV